MALNRVVLVVLKKTISILSGHHIMFSQNNIVTFTMLLLQMGGKVLSKSASGHVVHTAT